MSAYFLYSNFTSAARRVYNYFTNYPNGQQANQGRQVVERIGRNVVPIIYLLNQRIAMVRENHVAIVQENHVVEQINDVLPANVSEDVPVVVPQEVVAELPLVHERSECLTRLHHIFSTTKEEGASSALRALSMDGDLKEKIRNEGNLGEVFEFALSVLNNSIEKNQDGEFNDPHALFHILDLNFLKKTFGCSANGLLQRKGENLEEIFRKLYSVATEWVNFGIVSNNFYETFINKILYLEKMLLVKTSAHVYVETLANLKNDSTAKHISSIMLKNKYVKKQINDFLRNGGDENYSDEPGIARVRELI